MGPLDPDLALRQAAITRVSELRQAYDDLVPLPALREGFLFREGRVPFSSFQKGIHRARDMRGPAALSVLRAARALRHPFAAYHVPVAGAPT
jgi:hypothetical protein